MRWTVVALSLLCALAAVASATRASNEDRPMICPSDQECYPLFFEATDEFQVVKPGQVLDPSMHTKMDSQTGVLEAKLRSVAEEDTTTLGVIEEDPDAPAAEPERMTEERYAELKAAFEVLMEAVGSESRSMVQALEMLQKADRTDEDILGALDVLGDLLPGIDNAVDFAKAGGMRVVVQLLDELNAEVRTAAALALAGALRNNPEAQTHTFEFDDILGIAVARLGRDGVSEAERRADLSLLSSALSGRDDAFQAMDKSGALARVLDIITSFPSKRTYRDIVRTVSYSFVVAPVDAQVNATALLRDAGWCESLASHLLSSDLLLVEDVAMALARTGEVCNVELYPRLADLRARAAFRAVMLGETDENGEHSHAELIELLTVGA